MADLQYDELPAFTACPGEGGGPAQVKGLDSIRVARAQDLSSPSPSDALLTGGSSPVRIPLLQEVFREFPEFPIQVCDRHGTAFSGMQPWTQVQFPELPAPPG